MKKNFLQDVIPANHRRSIRDVPLPSHRTKESVKPRPTHQEPLRVRPDPVVMEEKKISEPMRDDYSFENKQRVFDPQHLQSTEYSEKPASIEYKVPVQNPPIKVKKAKSSFFKKAFIFVLIGVLVFFGFVFSRTQAKIVIYPKQDSYEVDVTIPTDVSSIAAKTQITKTASMSLEATSEEQVEKQAVGRIRIINYHAEINQELVKNTRFQTAEGLIYQIKDSIVIPGYKMNGGTVVPGTLEVDVYASSAGEEYNIGKTKFTIPGFQGRAQFEKITAESVTDMTGGYIGIKKVVSEKAQEEARTTLKEQLTSQFTPEPTESDSNIIIPNIETVSFGEIKDEVSGNTVTMSLTGTADAYSFKKQDLFNFIGQNTVIGSTPANMFSLDSKALSFVIKKNAISVKGSVLIIWITDLENLKQAIAGKKRSEIETVVNSYNSIKKSDIGIKPFWKTKFPTDTSRIVIENAQ